MKGTAILYEENHVVACLENITFTDIEKYNPHHIEETQDMKPNLTIWHPEDIDWDYGY